MNGGSNDKFDERLGKAAQEYNEPPATPRDAMWARILAGRAERHVTRLPKPVPLWRSPRMWVPAAAAAVLLIGIAIGRLTLPDDGVPVARDSSDTTVSGTIAELKAESKDATAYQLAAIPILSQAELLLTQFRTGETETVTENGGSFGKRAASLLTDTRLLLDSPAADDPRMKRLLGDLELVLVQMVQMTAEDEEDEREEKELITESMSTRSLLPRLRANAATGTFTSTY
jgi:hypothetical protein